MEPMEDDSPVPTRAKSSLTPHDHSFRRSSRNSRVHFDEDGYIPQLQEANPILVQVTGEERSKTIGVYLGFLQEEHAYDVKFSIPSSMIQGYVNPPSVQGPDGKQIKAPVAGVVLPTPAKDPIRNGNDQQECEETEKEKDPISTFLGNVELFARGELCEVTDMEWIGEKAPGLLIHMNVTVPSTKHAHVMEDTFCIRSAAVPDRFLRLNVAAKIMGKTMGTPTLKDGIKCIGVCPSSGDSSDTDSTDSEKGQKNRRKNSSHAK